MTKKEIILPKGGPKPVGPYSPAIIVRDLLFISGQIGIQEGGELIKGGVAEETRQVMQNIKSIIASAKCSMENVVKTTIFLKEINDFSTVNAVYAEFFQSEPPARSTVQVASLPKGALVEIEAIAFFPQVE